MCIRDSPDALTKADEEDAAARFAELFNTCTLPEERYYDLQAHDRRLREAAAAGARGALRQEGGGGEGARADERRFAEERARARREAERERLGAAMAAMRHGGLAQDMREQAMLRAEIDLAYKTGDTARARKLAERLKPEKK